MRWPDDITHSTVNGLPMPVSSSDVAAAGGVAPIPPFEDYVLARSCPKCGAQPGERCTVRNRGKQWHAQRADSAITHRFRDQATAPFPEYMELGVSYGTLDNIGGKR